MPSACPNPCSSTALTAESFSPRTRAVSHSIVQAARTSLSNSKVMTYGFHVDMGPRIRCGTVDMMLRCIRIFWRVHPKGENREALCCEVSNIVISRGSDWMGGGGAS
ncbi:hypothetical protein CONPUDRAFT_84083 [Coniophora puteana RWD-64-598 SS2]|uniref:Uncharacterized protein n=1 Tax=Coniophora puteana (strain RWD-64-598) TaxID=741705 RepID=A0A5M3MGD2_CONPW|nr:uncharacterized protein CONPUDRAFT_84083 [Coniophora puteana RWD-64-598 SS2]EIW77675.1 hypothetical protein CONPUDRAFT_84083 [Coniophora puteana RWD-64-598 SS2]